MTLDIEFSSGPWVVLGVNGIGKSTLLLLLKHTLIGPYVSRQAGFAGEGTKDISNIDKRLFTVRVEDDATNATVALETYFGASRLVTRRELADLSLVSASLETEEGSWEIETEGRYQQILSELLIPA